MFVVLVAQHRVKLRRSDTFSDYMIASAITSAICFGFAVVKSTI